ncbi:leucyl aminopeptidase [Candidatus Magnetaquicoccus inordinatus]|uniref:leucyl aminopeptidase n=1 Tax=Candidatus Magnetaquicoccus inordinatus TaxID=2496818 RepID=UPI00102D2517|nr:leucyl aminopeptidase [Candidatus Magnetaquicoccus inordinatus]
MDKNGQALQIGVMSGTHSSWKGDALVIGVYEGGEPQPALIHCGKKVESEVRKRLAEGWLRGALGESVLLVPPAGSGLAASRLLLLGMGKKESLNTESFRTLGGHLTQLCHKMRIAECTTLLSLDSHHKAKNKRQQIPVAEALAEGAWMGNYRFESYKSKESKKEEREEYPFKQLYLLVAGERLAAEKRRLTEVEAIARGVVLARDLANQPGNVLNPEGLAEQARQLAGRFPAIKTTVYSERMLARKGMQGILAVGSGSQSPPRLITMEYRKGGDRPLLAVVGKGITFDSGGISLKPGEGMGEMKFDMCGGAAVFGLLQAVAELSLPINLLGVVPAAENMPSGTAQRPGDVIRMAKGVTVEVLNTDAEGRLILADALYHASSFKPAVIIDLATLTGACAVALGAHASGLMGNDNSLLRQLEKAGEASGDRLWRLPMYSEYQEQIKSTVADIKNIGGRLAGAITAGCFLSRFVEEKQAWAHIDIAGTAYDMNSSRPHFPKGAAGVGVRLLSRFIQSHWL